MKWIEGDDRNLEYERKRIMGNWRIVRWKDGWIKIKWKCDLKEKKKNKRKEDWRNKRKRRYGGDKIRSLINERRRKER